MASRRSAAGVAVLAWGLLMSAGGAAAQQPPHWRFFTSSDGLRESWVLDVTPGSNGRWWITHGNVDSLSIFDGYTIRRLPSPGATVAVREGPTGQIWSLLPRPTVLDVYDGVQLYEDGHWTSYPLQGLPTTAGEVRRWHFLPWALDHVLVMTPDALIEFDRASRTQRVLIRAQDTGLRRFSELIPAAAGGAWIGGRGGVGLLAPPPSHDRPTLTEHHVPAAFAGAEIFQLHEAKPGTVFASVLKGATRVVLHFDGQTWREVTRLPAGSEDRIESWRGLDHEVWIARTATRSFQLELARSARPPTEIERTSPLSGRLNAVRSAGQGAFWLATSLGLVRHAPAAGGHPTN